MRRFAGSVMGFECRHLCMGAGRIVLPIRTHQPRNQDGGSFLNSALNATMENAASTIARWHIMGLGFGWLVHTTEARLRAAAHGQGSR